jgi:ribosome-binding factor A
MRQFKRSDRLAQQILRDVSVLLEEELASLGAGLVTFTKVRLTDHLRLAQVFYSSLGDDESKEKVAVYLERHRGRIRSSVGRNLHIRHIPELIFKFDPSVEHGIRIERLLNEIKSDLNEDKP